MKFQRNIKQKYNLKNKTSKNKYHNFIIKQYETKN